MTEVWKEIPGCEGLYSISNFGNVKSHSRWVTGGRGKQQHVPEKILKQTKDSYGYFVVTIRQESGKPKVVKVHRLVLLAFVGDSDLMCCHIDGNPTNNHLDNLRYGTAQDNANDRTLHGKKVGAIGESNGQAKLTSYAVSKIKQLLTQEISHTEIATMFGVCAESIRKIAIGKTWKHI